jgi:hypothetical protein
MNPLVDGSPSPSGRSCESCERGALTWGAASATPLVDSREAAEGIANGTAARFPGGASRRRDVFGKVSLPRGDGLESSEHQRIQPLASALALLDWEILDGGDEGVLLPDEHLRADAASMGRRGMRDGFQAWQDVGSARARQRRSRSGDNVARRPAIRLQDAWVRTA